MNIWYIEFLDSWATTDKTGALHIWDIALNRVRNSYYITGEIKKEYNNLYGNASNPEPSSMTTSLRGKTKSFKSFSTFKNRDHVDSPSHSNKQSQRPSQKYKGHFDSNKPTKNKRNSYVIDLTEIGYLKLIATASTDKQIRIWDMRNENKAKVLFCLNMVKGGVH